MTKFHFFLTQKQLSLVKRVYKQRKMKIGQAGGAHLVSQSGSRSQSPEPLEERKEERSKKLKRSGYGSSQGEVTRQLGRAGQGELARENASAAETVLGAVPGERLLVREGGLLLELLGPPVGLAHAVPVGLPRGRAGRARAALAGVGQARAPEGELQLAPGPEELSAPPQRLAQRGRAPHFRGRAAGRALGRAVPALGAALARLRQGGLPGLPGLPQRGARGAEVG